jgi:hypothetical protein
LIIQTITSSKTKNVPKNNKSWWHEAIEYCQNIILYQIVPKAPVITKKSRGPYINEWTTIKFLHCLTLAVAGLEIYIKDYPEVYDTSITKSHIHANIGKIILFGWHILQNYRLHTLKIMVIIIVHIMMNSNLTRREDLF